MMVIMTLLQHHMKIWVFHSTNFFISKIKDLQTNAIMSLQAQNPFGLSPDTSYAGIIIHSELADFRWRWRFRYNYIWFIWE